jgi:hypothetical protein
MFHFELIKDTRMTRKQAAMWPVIKAFYEGYDVECREKGIIGKEGWHTPPDPENPSFSPSAEWRVRPEWEPEDVS